MSLRGAKRRSNLNISMQKDCFAPAKGGELAMTGRKIIVSIHPGRDLHFVSTQSVPTIFILKIP
jgi:hypothetical protein